MFDATTAIQRQCHFRGSKKFKRYSPIEQHTIQQSNIQTCGTPETLIQELSQAEETMAKIGNILLKSAEDSETDNQQHQLNKTNYHFLACYEDSSFLYRREQQRKHSRRLKSPGASSTSGSSSPSSSSYMNSNPKSSSNTTADSMLTPNTFSSSSSSSSSSSRCDSSSPSASSSPELMSPFRARGPAAPKRRSPDSVIESSSSELSPPPAKTATITTTRDRFARGSSNYFDDERVFYNLIHKERAELERRQLALNQTRTEAEDELTGELRHSLLAWMLRVCEHQVCQDEIFPLATIILEKFLQLNPISRVNYYFCHERQAASQNQAAGARTSELDSMIDTNSNSPKSKAERAQQRDGSGEPDDQLVYLQCPDNEANELAQRQLFLFAACSLLLATKLRQTPRLCVQTLIDFSRLELPLELSREEILDAEVLMLSLLKWDLAALVTPNDFLQILARKCQNVLANFLHCNRDNNNEDNDSDNDAKHVGFGRASPKLDCESEPETANKCRQQHQQQQNKLEQHHHHHHHHHHHQQQQQRQLKQQDKLTNRCDESRVRRHTQTLLELCLMDSRISQHSASVLAMASMAVAIDGLSMSKKTSWRLNEIVTQIHESTNKVNELKHMIEVATKIEKYVQSLLRSSTQDD